MKFANIPSVDQVKADIAEAELEKWREKVRVQKNKRSFEHANYQDEMKFFYLYGTQDNTASEMKKKSKQAVIILRVFLICLILFLMIVAIVK